MDRLVTQKELAECLRLTARQVRNLKADGLFQESMEGKKYILTKCIPEYIEYKVKAETGRGASISKEKVQIEHEMIKANISRLKLRKLKKELHDAADVELFLSDMLIRFKKRLLSLPTKIAIKISGEKDVNRIIATVEGAMREALEELSDYDPDKIDGTSGNGDDFDDDFDDDGSEEDTEW